MPGLQAGPASPREVLDFVLDYLASIDASRARGASRADRTSSWPEREVGGELMAWRDTAKSADLLSAAAEPRIEPH